jgi:hypothetical protein
VDHLFDSYNHQAARRYRATFLVLLAEILQPLRLLSSPNACASLMDYPISMQLMTPLLVDVELKDKISDGYTVMNSGMTLAGR